LRPGHGATGGAYLEDQGSCAMADYAGAGRATADSLAAAIAYMTGQDFVRRSGVVVIGNSAGGWGALALAARNPPDVAAIVNIAGGRGGRNLGRADSNCAPDRLVAAAAAFGRTARIPSLWLYARTDTYFPPTLSQRLADAYRAAGAPVDYRLLDVPGEGHELIESTAWRDALSAFLAR
jgi:dienelactone hydrolase